MNISKVLLKYILICVDITVYVYIIYICDSDGFVLPRMRPETGKIAVRPYGFIMVA